MLSSPQPDKTTEHFYPKPIQSSDAPRKRSAFLKWFRRLVLYGLILLLILTIPGYFIVRACLSYSDIHLFTSLGFISELERLIETGADIQERGPVGMSPLHCAAMTNQLEAAEFLLEQGAMVNARSYLGERHPCIMQ